MGGFARLCALLRLAHRPPALAGGGLEGREEPDHREAVEVAKDQPDPLGIAADGLSIYWTASAYVRKVRK